MVDLWVAEHKTASSGKPSPVMVTASGLQQLKNMAHQTRARAPKLKKAEPKYVFSNVTTDELEPSTATTALIADWDRHFKEMFGVTKNHVKFTATAWRHLEISSLSDAGITRQEQKALAKHMAHNLDTADRKYDDSKQTEIQRDCLGKAVELA